MQGTQGMAGPCHLFEDFQGREDEALEPLLGAPDPSQGSQIPEVVALAEPRSVVGSREVLEVPQPARNGGLAGLQEASEPLNDWRR